MYINRIDFHHSKVGHRALLSRAQDSQKPGLFLFSCCWRKKRSTKIMKTRSSVRGHRCATVEAMGKLPGTTRDAVDWKTRYGHLNKIRLCTGIKRICNAMPSFVVWEFGVWINERDEHVTFPQTVYCSVAIVWWTKWMVDRKISVFRR